MLFLIFEIGAQYNMDLDLQWVHGRKRTKVFKEKEANV